MLSKQTSSISNSLVIKFAYSGTNYQLTVTVNYNNGFGITTINKTYDKKNVSNGNTTINLKTEIAKALGNVASSRITIDSIDSSNGFLASSSNKYQVFIYGSKIKNLSVSTVSNLNFKFKVDNGAARSGVFKVDIKVDGQSNLNNNTNNGNGTTTPEEEACYEFSNTGVYYWGTKTNADTKGQGMTPKKTNKTKAECSASNADKKKY